MRVAVLDDYQNVAESLVDWSRLGAEVVFFSDHAGGPQEVVDRLRGFDVVVAMRERTPFPREVLASLPDLRLLVTTGARNASIDIRAADESGIVVSGTDSLPHPTAELTMALMLALSRGIVAEVQSVRAGGWQVGLGRDLAGATLGIIGLGRLGLRVASLARPFGMEIIGRSASVTPERAAEAGVTTVPLEVLLTRADFVTIHLRLSERTRGLIGAGQLALMKPTAYLINTSRGAIADEDALLDAVRRGVVAGAAIDVFDREPLPPDHGFRSEPRILATPHIGYVTSEGYRVFFEGVVESIAAWQAGTPIRVVS